MRKLRVLVIDDSAFNRQVISEVLTSHPEIEVVGKGSDGEEGLKLAMQLKPDLITLDIEMPRMDGFTFLRLLMAKAPTPVIVISSHSRKEEVFKALELGALDFIAKPSHHLGPDLGKIRQELISKTLTVKALELSTLKRRSETRTDVAKEQPATAKPAKNTVFDEQQVERLVVIGSSTGGPPALEYIFKNVPAVPGVAFLVAQHMPEKFTRAFAERLNRMASMTIVEAQDRMPVRAGYVYVAAGGAHTEIGRTGSGELILNVFPQTPTDRYAPSIDRLFKSAAATFRGKVLGVVLTGMGNDGSEGVGFIRKEGGVTLAENQESAVVYGMPKEAIRTGNVQEALALIQITERIVSFVSGALAGGSKTLDV